VAAGKQSGRPGRQAADANLTGQSVGVGKYQRREQHRQQLRGWQVYADLRGLLVLGIFHRTTARIVRARLSIAMTTADRLAGQKFKAGQGFQLAMCGNWQPEKGCQRKK